MKKKLLVTLLTVSMILSLVACGKSEEVAATEVETETAVESETETTTEAIEEVK